MKRISGIGSRVSVAINILVLAVLAACTCAPHNSVPPDTPPSPVISPSPTPQLTISPDYPFDKRNMFFGLSLINTERDAPYVKELGISWLSLQPLVVWFAIESQPGVYDWSSLDREIEALQNLNLDVTMVLSPVANTFGQRREEIASLIAQYPSLTAFFREGNVAELALYPHDETLPIWVNFIKAAVDRYDGDGKNDMPGLKYCVRNWHFVEEYPIPEIEDAKVYTELLKITHQAIKSEDPEAKVILAGLAGNYLRYFAFMDGLITDEDAGVINGERHPRIWWQSHPFWKKAKAEYESILDTGRDYFDIVDIHAYIIKETFMEGEIEYIRQAMQRRGYSKPIWIIEGGGPFKNYPGKKAVNTPADPYFGMGSEKENAEFVIKLLVMSAAASVERQHWGLGSENTDNGYWDGPWKGMGLMDPDKGYKKPSYYTFKLMREKLDGFIQVRDLSRDDLRIFCFQVATSEISVAWKVKGSQTVDLRALLGSGDIKITHIVTELDASLNPVYPESSIVNSATVPLSLTPVFLEVAK